MDPRLPCDVDPVVPWSWSFPTSCSLASVPPADGCEELSSGGRSSPSTGMIPILLFGDDIRDLLEPDSAASPSPPFGIPNNVTGYPVVSDLSSAILKLDIVGSPAVHASSGELPESPMGGNERNGFNYSHCQLHYDPVDRGPSSVPTDDNEEERYLSNSLHFDPEPQLSVCSRCRPSFSRSSSFGCMSQASALLNPNTQRMRRTCYSCCASPAAINNAPLIAAAKHQQNFALEDLLICQPSSNSFTLYGCVEQDHLPLNPDHDHLFSDQQQCACGAPSSTFSSVEADLSIDFPPRDCTMDHSFPPPYPLSTEPSSSSSSSNSNLPLHLAWLHDTTISLCIDQESFRTVFPTFKPVGYTQPHTPPIHSLRAGMQNPFAGGIDGKNSPYGSPMKQQHSELVDQASMDPDSAGMAEFMPLKRESFVFHHSTLDPPPSIRRLSVNGDESRDHLSQYAYLGIKSSGRFQVYVVRGSETRRGGGSGDGEVTTPGRSTRARGSSSTLKLEWRFEYAVEDKRKADGTKAGNGEKFLTPLRFSCSPELLHPRQGRKVTVLSVWKKSIQPRVLANRLEPIIIPSPTTPGNQTHNLLSSPTSPKSPGAGGLRFPSASKLWGKRTKASPYPFDKGSDGSEEELIPSEDSVNRRKRRPTSAYVPRVSLEVEWPLQKWDRDRGKSADAVWQVNRDARPATAGAEGSRWRTRDQSFGRGAASEGENDRASSRSRGGLSTTRRGHNRRPRTAR